MRRVSGEKRRARPRRLHIVALPAAGESLGRGPALRRAGKSQSVVQRRHQLELVRVVSGGRLGTGGSAVAVSVSDAIQRLDLLEVLVDLPELLAQSLDMAVD